MGPPEGEGYKQIMELNEHVYGLRIMSAYVLRIFRMNYLVYCCEPGTHKNGLNAQEMCGKVKVTSENKPGENNARTDQACGCSVLVVCPAGRVWCAVVFEPSVEGVKSPLFYQSFCGGGKRRAGVKR